MGVKKLSKSTKINELRNAFSRIFRNHLDDVGTYDDMQSVYVIPESATDTMIKELLYEVSIRFYTGGK